MSKHAITRVLAREVLDSRGRPTVEAEVRAGDASGRAIAPSGASTGAAEARELRDGDGSRYGGLGVSKAVGNVNEIIAPALLGVDCGDQAAVDRRLLELDSTPQKTRLGGNALVAVSLAAAHAAARARRVPLYRHLWGELQRLDGGQRLFPAPRLPRPMTNMISGGLHAGGNLDIQDVLVIPSAAPDYATGLEWIVGVYTALGERLRAIGAEGRLVGDEGGYGPRLSGNEQAIELVVEAIEAAGKDPRDEMRLALDIAATHFCDSGGYRLASEGGRLLDCGQWIEQVLIWANSYPIATIEDPLHEDDWPAWQALAARIPEGVLLVGDDLFATNPARVKKGIELAAAGAVLVKVNQIGTLTETFETMRAARAAGLALVVSARSGETEDTTIADLATAAAAEMIKIGGVARSERLAKYNRLLRIESELGNRPWRD